MNYPENCLKGIPKKEYIIPEGTVSAAAFYPDERTAVNRIDGCIETSINWEDDEYTLGFTLLAFPNGVVRLALTEINRIQKMPSSQNGISYERNPLSAIPPQPENPYHGNILFQERLSNPLRKMIAANFAMACSHIITK